MPTAPADPRLVARIGKAHGIRGEVTVQAHTDDPDRRFAPGEEFTTQAAAGTGVPRILTLRSARLHNGIWLLAFEEIPDRTGAESLRGTLLLADGEVEPADEDLLEGSDLEDGFYEDQLVGLAAYDPAGARIGTVTGLTIGPQDLLEIALDDGRSGLVPFVHALVPTVDLHAGRVVIDAPAGLFDLD